MPKVVCEIAPEYEGDQLIALPEDVVELLDEYRLVENPRRGKRKVRTTRRGSGKAKKVFKEAKRPTSRFPDDDLVETAVEAVVEAVDRLFPEQSDEVAEQLYSLEVFWWSRGYTIGRCVYDSEVSYNRLGHVSLIKQTPAFITINKKYALDNDKLYEVLVHEFCHAADTLTGNRYTSPSRLLMSGPDYSKGHGPSWQNLMRASGQEPAQYCTDPDIAGKIKEERIGRRERRAAKKQERRDAILDALDAKSSKEVTHTNCRKGRRVYLGVRTRSGSPKILNAKVVRCNPKTITVEDTAGRTFKVSPTFLRYR